MLTKPRAASLKSSGSLAEAITPVYLFFNRCCFPLLEWKGLSRFLQPCYCALFQEPVDLGLLGKLTHQFQLWRKGLVSLSAVWMMLSLRSPCELMASFHIYLEITLSSSSTGSAHREQKSAAASSSPKCITVRILIEFVSHNLDHFKWWGKGRGSEIWASKKKKKEKLKAEFCFLEAQRAPCKSSSAWQRGENSHFRNFRMVPLPPLWHWMLTLLVQGAHPCSGVGPPFTSLGLP